MGKNKKGKKLNTETGYIGVAIDKNTGKFYAHLQTGGKKYTKHGFDTAKEAYEKGRLDLEEEHLNNGIYTKDDVEKMNLPEGVRPVYNPLNITFRATYKSNGTEKKRTFKTPEEAIAQRKAWVEEYGEPNNAAPIKDLVGKRFGRLVVTKFAYSKGGVIYWECKCDCGNTTVVQGNNLKSRSIVSCGCYIKELSSEQRQVDIKGEKFGKLTAIKKLDKKTSHGNAIWLCKCDCGNYTEALLTTLRSGDKIQCEDCRDEFLKNENAEKMRQGLSEPQIDGVQVLRFRDKPNRNSKTGYIGVFYNTRTAKYVGHLRVNGKTYTKGGFKTAEEAYYKGRLVLEDEHLPPKDDMEALKEEIRKNK